MVDPWLAFSADNVVIPGLLEGIVFPEKDEGALQGCLFKNRSQAKELFAETRVSKEPVLVRVLVGTKDGIEKWLRISGPASCALWIEISEDKQNTVQIGIDGLVTGQLRLAYRLRSHSASYLTVLRGACLILSPYHKSRFELQSLRRREKGTLAEVEWSESPLSKWLLLMSDGAFRHLLCMIEPGGVLAEFQTLLKQLADSPNFLDVNFRHLDLPFWLSRYPFVLSLDGFNLLVLTRDMKWTILRFDCFEGVMKIANSSGADEGDSEDALQSTLKHMDPGKLFQVHDWSLWEEVSMQKDARRIGPLGAIVFNNFYMDGKGFVGGVAVQESLDCLVKSWKEAGMKVKYVFCISGATIFELKASNLFPTVRLSMEEQSALSSLQSGSRAERQQGLNVLIELLLGDMSENATENPIGLAARTSFRGIVSSARDSIINWNTFHEVNSDGFQLSSNKPAFGAQKIGWMRLLEWSNRKFFEALLDEALLVSDSVHELDMHRVPEALLKVLDIIPGEASSRFSAISIAHLKDCVTKIQHLVNPHERSDLKRRNFSPILEDEGQKKHFCRQILDAQDEDTVKHNEMRYCKPVEIFQELHCMSKILSLVAHGSSVVPGVVAECDGASLALETFLDLVRIFSDKSTGRKTDVVDGSVLPGEVLENKDVLLKICPLVGAEISQSLNENSRNNSAQCSAVELAFTSSRINAMLQPQRKGHDQSNIKEAFHSTVLAKVLMKLILRKVGFASTVRGLSLSPFSQSMNSDIGRINQRTAKTKLNLSPMKECVAKYLSSDVVLSLATDAKYHLLSAAAAILTNKSLALLEAKQALIKKFSGERRVQLVGSFLEELVQVLRRGLSEKLQEHIFQILYILDKVEETNSQGKALTEPARLPAGSAMFSVIMLSEVGVQLKAALSQQKVGGVRLWITVGSLLQVLTAFICKWPEEKAASLVFQCCGAQIETILHVLCLSGGPNEWNPGQLVLMQNVLRLFGTTMEHSSHSDSSTQRELDNVVWNIVIDNNDHWEFVRCYSQWIVFDACPECVWNLLEEYCWSVWEPLEVHDLSGPPLQVGNPSPSWLPRWLPSLQCEEIPLKNLLSFLRLIIGVIQRKVDRGEDGLKLLMPGKARLLLEFLMNPVNGLLMKLLKGDSFQKKRTLPLKDFGTAYFHLKHVREDLRNLIPFCTQRQVICRIPNQASPKGEISSFNRRYRGRSSLCEGFTQASTISKHTAEGLANITYELAYLAATNIEIASLQLLASIFALNFHGQRLSPKRLVAGNPFLGRKYAYPFLDFHFLRFIQLYYVNFLQGQRVYNKDAESPLEKVNENSCTVAWCAEQDSACSEADIRDEQVSLECAVHLQVLLALAQNQTEEVSVRFKQLRVMDFLVHQIALEYEASQVATPRDVVRINKALASQLKSSGRASGSHRKDAVKGQSSRGTDSHQLANAGNPSPHISERSHPSWESSLGSSSITTPSLAGLKKGLTVACSLHSLAEVGGSTRLCLGKKGVLGKHLQLMCKDIPKLELGFLSARNMGSMSHLESSCESYLLNRPFTGRHEFLLKWQEVMKPNVPNLPVDKAWGRESGHQSGEERKVAFPDELRQNISEEDNKKHSATLVGVTECDIADRHGDQQVEPETKAKLVYSGRFFDLNEEVERELAEEDNTDVPEWQDDRTEEDSDHDTDETSGEDSDGSMQGRDNTGFRPLIPKLNLPRSARKGEQESGSHSTSTTTEAKSEFPKFEKKSPGIPLSGDIITSGSSSRPLEPTTPYELERSQRRLYRNSSLHLFLLELYITLMLTSQGTLEQSYSDRFQTEKQKLNAPFFLFYHLNHVANSYLVPCLAERMRTYHPSAFRILRLSWRGLFNPSLYKNRIRIAHGASAQIYKATYDDGNEGNGPKLVVLKTVDLPKGPYEPCKFFDVYSEVQILEKFMGEPRVCQLLDYGVESETFVLVLKHYKCSLRAWRLNQGVCLEPNKAGNLQKSFFERLPLYLEVYAAVLDAVKGLEMHNVVHYDLKCDNVLLEPIDPVLPEEEFWDPIWPPTSDNSYRLPFKVCLTDFGQSKTSIFQGGECTYRNRGTEYVKSPEMLKLLRTSSEIGVHQADESVGKAVDVWGLGCLLYELLAAEYLLYDEDWMHFFVRVTMHSEELITNEKAEKVGNFGPVVDFIRFVLVRDPSRRPTLDEVMIHLKQLQASLGGFQTAPRHEPHVLSNMDSVYVPPATGFMCDGPSDSSEVEKPSKSFKLVLASWLCCWCWGHHAVE